MPAVHLHTRDRLEGVAMADSKARRLLLDELARLTQTPVTQEEERIRRHLECEKSVKLCSALADALQPLRNQSQRVLDAPTEMLAPLH